MLDNLRCRSRNRLFHRYADVNNGLFKSNVINNSHLDVHVNIEEFSQECLRSHNHYRAQHGCASLHLSMEMSRFSQQWADRISEESHLHHSCHPQYGENLFVTYFTDHSRPATRGSEVVDSWYSEHSLYNSNERATREILARAGHFTQVVWSSSRELGVGRALGRDNRLYVVANYYPAGNILRKLPDNVPKRVVGSHHENHGNNCYSRRLYTKSTEFKTLRLNEYTQY